MVKQRFQIFDKVLKYFQVTQIDNVYIAMGLHNFIKIQPKNEKIIYFALIDISNNVGSDNNIFIIQSNLAQIKNLKDKIASRI